MFDFIFENLCDLILPKKLQDGAFHYFMLHTKSYITWDFFICEASAARKGSKLAYIKKNKMEKNGKKWKK